MTASLEKLIKDLEFENEDIIRHIKDEINQIDEMQKHISSKIQENSKLDKDISLLNEETKVLHGQFKQNRELVESLKRANNLVCRHSEDLKKSLQLQKEETKMEWIEHKKVLSTYSEKWEAYKEVYEERPLVQILRKLKLDAASLDVEDKKIVEEKEALQRQLQELKISKGDQSLVKENAVQFIVKLAQSRQNTQQNVLQLKKIEREQNEKQKKLQEQTKALVDLNLHIEKANAAKLQAAQEANRLRNEQLARDTSNRIIENPQNVLPTNVKETANTQPSTTNNVVEKHKFPRFSQPKPFQLPKLSQLKLPKIPQLPKFPTFAKHSKVKPLQQMPSAPVQEKLEPPVIHASMIPPPVIPPSMIPASMVPPSMIPPSNIIEVQPKTPGHVVTAAPNTNVGEEMEGVFSVPLEQSTKEFFGEKIGRVGKSPGKPSSFTFSPGQHAEQLKMLKQSPGYGYMHTTRPMFNKNGGGGQMQEVQEEDKVSMEIEGNRFSIQNEFMGDLRSSQQVDSTNGETSSDSFMFSMATGQQANTVNEPPSTFSFENPTVESPNNTFNFDASKTPSAQPTSSNFSSAASPGAMMNFSSPNDSFNFQAPTATPINQKESGMFAFSSDSTSSPQATDSMFSFGVHASENIGNAANSSFNLALGGPPPTPGGTGGFNFSNGAAAGDSDLKEESSMFDFSMKNDSNSASSDVNMFDFGASSLSSVSREEKQPFNFGNSPASTSNTASSFSFNF